MATGSMYCLVVFAILGFVAFLMGLAAVLHRIGHRKGAASIGTATITELPVRNASEETGNPSQKSPPS